MTIRLDTLPGLLLGLFALVAIIGSLASYFNTTRLKTTLQTSETDNEVLRRRVNTLVEEEASKETRIKSLEQKVTEQEGVIKVLTDRLTGAPDFLRLEDMLIEQHVSVLEGFDKVAEAIGKFTDEVIKSSRDRT